MPCWRPISQVRFEHRWASKLRPPSSAASSAVAARRQLGVQQAAVAGEAAAGGGDRDHDLVGELGGDRGQVAVELEVAGRAGRVDGDRAELARDLEPRQQPLARPGDRVEDLELRVALGVDLAQQRRPPRPRARACRSWRRRRPAARRRRSSARARRPCGWPSAARPSAKPFEVHGVAQQWPATSAGIQSGRPGALGDRDQRLGQARAPARRPLRARPKIRLTQAGR